MRTLLVLCAVIAATSTATVAESLDPHAVYEQRCAACHLPHARELAESALDRRDGKVVLKGSGQSLRQFLAHHPRRAPTPAEAEALDRHFNAMLQTGFLYHQKCSTCHDRAVVVARLFLTLRDGQLVGRYTGRDIATFLEGHGRLDANEVPVIAEMLARQLRR